MEQWRDIPESLGYQVSDQGNIGSFWGMGLKKGLTNKRRILCSYIGTDGYYYVNEKDAALIRDEAIRRLLTPEGQSVSVFNF